MRLWLAGFLTGAVLTGLAPIASEAATANTRRGSPGQSSVRKSGAWITVRSIALKQNFGELPARDHQDILGRLKLDHVSRVSSVVIHGKKITGDLLVIKGEYQNMTGQPAYWTEDYAFVFGTNPTRCTQNVCGAEVGALPKGDWTLMTHDFGTPIVDYPAERAVPANRTVSFREAIPMPPGSPASPTATAATAKHNSPVIHSLRDIWLLPIYAAFNYFETPFPHSQLVRLSSYFGQTAMPGS